MDPLSIFFEYYLLFLIANNHKIVTKYNVMRVNVIEPD
jgi:hypothetical protein